MEVFQHCCWLGHGSYGDVQLCEVSSRTMEMLLGAEHQQVDKQAPAPILIALKTWKNAHKEGKVMQIALREVQLLKAVSHPNIIKLQSAFRTQSGHVCMVFEYGGKSTHQLLETRFPGGFPQPKLQRLTFQIVQALRYLHSRKIVHRDVKPANILVDSEGVLRLCDFGFARYLSGSTNPEAVLLSTTRDGNDPVGDGSGDSGLWTPYVITRWYRAPEVLLGMPYGAQADVWSLGCTLAELAIGEPLLPGTSSVDQIGLIANLLGPLPNHMTSRVTFPPTDKLRSGAALPAGGKVAPAAVEALRQRLGPDHGAEFLDLITACLKTDPRGRPTMEQLLGMPYLLDAARLFDGSSLADTYSAVSLAGPVNAARKLAAPSQSFPPPQASGTDGSQSSKAQPVQPGQCRFHRCHPHPPPHQQHIHHQQQRCRVNLQQQQQQQQQQDSRARDMFRCSRGLQHSTSMNSSVDAGSTLTSASCSVMSTTPVMRSVTSVTDSSYSTIPLGSCTCCSICSGAAGISSDVVCTCHVESSNFVSGSASNAQPLLSPAVAAAATAAAVRPSSCRAHIGSSMYAAVARNTEPDPPEGLRGATEEAVAHPPLVGIGMGGSDGTCWRGTAMVHGSGKSCVNQACMGQVDADDPTAAMASSLSDVTIAHPQSLSVTAAAARPGPPTVHLDSQPAPPHPSGLSREAAIRAMTAAAAFATNESAAASTVAAAMAPSSRALSLYFHHHHHQQQQQQQQQCFAVVMRAALAGAHGDLGGEPVPCVLNEMLVRDNGGSGCSTRSRSSSSSRCSSSSGDSEQICASRTDTTGPEFAAAGAAATAAASDSFDVSGDGIETGARQAWRNPAVLRSQDDYDCVFDDGGDNGGRGGYTGGGRGTADHPMQMLTAHWLDNYYHDCSPVATSAAATVVAGLKAMATAAACGASSHTTVSFNWHNAESPCSGVLGRIQGNQPLNHTMALGSDAWPMPRPTPPPPKQQAVGQVLEMQPLAAQVQPPQPLKLRPEQQLLRRRRHLCGYVVAPAAAGAIVGASQAHPPPQRPAADISCSDDRYVDGSWSSPGDAGSGSDSDSGCRPRDLTWTSFALRRGYASAPGAITTITAAPNADACVALPCRMPNWTRARWAVTTTAGIRPQSGEVLRDAIVASGLACGPVWPPYGSPRDSERSTCEESMGMRRCDDAGDSEARSADVPIAATAAVVAAAAAAAAAQGPAGGAAQMHVAAGSVTVAAECINSESFSLDSTTGARSCCASIGEQRGHVTAVAEAGNTASAATCRDVSSRGNKSSHRFKRWLRKGRNWLRHLLQGSFPTRESLPR
ncbi:hypothetical protein VaNZ11_008145 [Volvox africanus]|uniref:Protein kinase domain-containing protein n=1 Tax=Volvox africanus TaxID=51714 RepID=A0ABQ5S5Y4_9CHLO|nr:hypothetical protein VaNZ11_008145 [Volvox africanus]